MTLYDDSNSEEEEGEEEIVPTPPMTLAKIQELEATIRTAKSNILRLRGLRDRYHASVAELTMKNTELKAEFQQLQKQQSKPEKNSQALVDSDEESLGAPDVKARAKSTTSRAFTRSSTPGFGNNKKYPDVPFFYGEKEKWDEWKTHLNMKFRRSAVLFPNEKDKMDYIRDHCKDIAFNVLRARTDPTHRNAYCTAQEMIDELHSIFGEYDVVSISHAKLREPDLAMGAKGKETFDEFYTRFESTIAPLDYDESMKIDTLRRLIIRPMQYQVAGTQPASYRSFVKELRGCYHRLRLAGLEDIDEEDFYAGKSNAASSTNAPYMHVYPAEFKATLKRKGRCFKCFEHGHRSNQTEACRQSKGLSFEEAKALLGKEGEN